MIGITLFFTALIGSAVYLMYSEHQAKKDRVLKLACGTKDDADIPMYNEVSNIRYTALDEFRNQENKIIDPSKYNKAQADGICMVPFGILDGDVVFYEPISNGVEPREGELVVIQIEGENNRAIRKIRAIDRILPYDKDNRTLETYYFIQKGDKWFRRRSSLNHKPEQVLGIVRHKVANKTRTQVRVLFL